MPIVHFSKAYVPKPKLFNLNYVNFNELITASHPSVGLRPDDGPGPGGLPRPALRAARTPGAPRGHLAVDHWGEKANKQYGI